MLSDRELLDIITTAIRVSPGVYYLRFQDRLVWYVLYGEPVQYAQLRHILSDPRTATTIWKRYPE